MNFINVTLIKRNDVSNTGGGIFNIDDIVSPIRKYGSSNSYFYTRGSRGRKNDMVQNGYKVVNSLANIKAQSDQLVSLTVVSRSGRPVSEVMLFDTRKIFEIVTVEYGVTVFQYEEERDGYFVKYGVTDTLASIFAQISSGTLIGTDVVDTQTITGSFMTLANTPTFIYGVFLNGQRLTLGVDYTITLNVIKFTPALDSDSVTVVYKY